ncbi:MULTISPECIES: N-acetylglucosamine-6-phosphate deacetylase [unclassified Sphingomonas]|uniref:N-acetylglucosamine-6-phosphate deacetylase n=1 Tax=unclassified Sphingomonas TaxID=196159 RepID=UPI0006FC97EC|nr:MULTISPECIES: N-acetylglucosamine-6-phosphate deacetylase [unclassified Sphingomonas]KQM61940.1 N-acetylglucosamine-6-phosphate deacetylase [Sphingomonas sp. Leaf16]KQN13213.1 N-acetylglucosamine-6-phosphate deacetylase [Sphingomonas sp. Leaf29]KQN20098.1 N-acetylglucosamine-6-phosphate deacetylase [Sphingomonas sp. Leaf32]
MSSFVFRGGCVLVDHGTQDSCAFRVEDGVIADFHAGDDAQVIDLDGGWLVPGYVDTQVNGGGGVLFNDHPTVEGIRAIGAAHAQYGTTAFLPTLISDSLEIVAAGLDAVDAAIEQGVPGVVGIHVEGPFLNPVRKGIHDAKHFRALDDAAIDLLTRPGKGVVMVTLAPERNDVAAIERLVAAGVIVSIGHSDATYEQARAAMDAGARGVTHLYNAMSPLKHRDPGVVGAVLEDRQVYAGLIVDGAHLHPAAIRVALAARPLDRFMLVTDAMPTVGAASKQFVLNGQPIHVENGVCVDDNGTLAGCDLDMAQAVANTVELGVGLADAVAMASANPAAFLRLSHRIGSIDVGHSADFVWLAADLTVRGTWIAGNRIV